MKRHSLYPEEGIYNATYRAALGKFLPPIVKQTFQSLLLKSGIRHHNFEPTLSFDQLIRTNDDQKNGVSHPQDNTPKETMIPTTLFFDNEQVLHYHLSLTNEYSNF